MLKNILYFLLLCCVLTLAHADGKAALESKLTKIKQNIAQIVNTIESKNHQRTDAEKKLYAIEKKLAVLNKKLRVTRTQIRRTQSGKSKLEEHYKHLDRELKALFTQLSKQIYHAYVHDSQSQLSFLLNQQKPKKFSRINTYYDYLHKIRQARIDKAQAMIREIDTTKGNIDSKHAQLLALQRTQYHMRTKLDKDRDVRATIVTRIKQELKNSKRELTKLKQRESAVQLLIQSLSKITPMRTLPQPTKKTVFRTLKGGLINPVASRPSNRFGALRKEGGMRWNGWFYPLEAGQAVRTVAAGRVVFANRLRGFGLLTIIDHGDKYLTLYGHNQDLTRSIGDWVNAGEVIAHAGNTGGLERVALYFELRHKGRPINPRQWFKK